MKKKVILVIVLVIVLIVGVVTFKNPGVGFSLNQNTKLIFNYDYSNNPRDTIKLNEYSEIYQLDDQGNIIQEDKLDGGPTFENTFNLVNDHFETFSYEWVNNNYTNGKNTTIKNQEMNDTYNFALDTAIGFIEDYEYIEKYDTTVHVAQHGLPYDLEDKGYFDLLVFSDGEQVYNVEVNDVDLQAMAVNQVTGDIFLVNNVPLNSDPYEQLDYVPVTKLMINDSTNKYEVSDNLEFTFVDEEVTSLLNDNDVSFSVGTPFVYDNTLYARLNVSQEEKLVIDNYVTFDFDNMTIKLDYEIKSESFDNYQKVDNSTLQIDGTIYTFFVTNELSENELPHYVYVKDDVVNKKSEVIELDIDLELSDNSSIRIKQVNDVFYILTEDLDQGLGVIYKLEPSVKDKLNKQFDFTLPKNDIQLGDFYYFE